MDRQIVADNLRRIISECLGSQGLELVDLIFRFEGRDLFLRILVDKPSGGISLDECAGLNRQIGQIIEQDNIIADRYILEVSSPGLDRPLKQEADFLRCMGKEAAFFLREPVNGKLEWHGLISAVGDKAVEVKVGDNTLTIALDNITKAKQEL